MSDIPGAANGSYAPMSITASKQLPRLTAVELDLGGIPADVGQFLPERSPSHRERTRGAEGR